MAIAEACQLWIEQRIEEELESGADNLSAIGRELSKEVDRVFQTKINPDTLRKRAARLTRTNVQGDETPATTPVKGGDSGDKMTPQEVVKQVDAIAHAPAV
ncbi:MAG: hypothetical protein AB7D37_03780 [Desulfovibrio sp.]